MILTLHAFSTIFPAQAVISASVLPKSKAIARLLRNTSISDGEFSRLLHARTYATADRIGRSKDARRPVPVKAAPSTASRPRDFMEVAITESTLMVARRTGSVSSSMSSYRAEVKHIYGRPKNKYGRHLSREFHEAMNWMKNVHSVGILPDCIFPPFTVTTFSCCPALHIVGIFYCLDIGKVPDIDRGF